MTEFELIEQVFRPLDSGRDDVALGIGDDAALLRPAPGELLVACIDTLVEGVHFPVGMAAFDIGYRVAAVNLSDCAAMGARPQWALLALTLPQVDADWLKCFGQGLAEALRSAHVALVGGDTTRGPLTISLQLLGAVPATAALTRSGAQPGDRVWVSGTLGDAAAGLRCFAAESPDEASQFLIDRFCRPQPRLALGMALRGIASACIDISDGLIADAGHIAAQSGVGMVLEAPAVPCSPALCSRVDAATALRLAATGGDDYELCFTAPGGQSLVLEALAATLDCKLTPVGQVTAGSGVLLRDASGCAIEYAETGYRHF